MMAGRIALITPGYSKSPEDWAIPALQNLVMAIARDYNVEVFALRYPFRPGRYTLDRVKVTALGGRQAAGPRRIPLLWRAWQAVAAAHRIHAFDLIHGFWADEAGYLAVQASARLGIPNIVSLMGGELVGFSKLKYGGQLSWFNRRFINFSLRKADVVTTGSELLLNLAHTRLREARTTRLPLGIDTRMFSPPDQNASPKTFGKNRHNILSVGSLVPIKGHLILLDAASKLRHAGIRFTLHIIGKGPLREPLEAAVIALDLGDSVVFHGHVSHPNLAPYYQTADLFVQSSFFESQGMAVLEAAACGVPVAGTATGILPEIVPAGWTSPVGDPQALADVLAALLSNPLDRQMQAAEICAHVREQFGVQLTASRLANEYQSLIKE